MNIRVNRWLDFFDRVGWTALQASLGALAIVLTEDGVTWQAGAKMVGVAALVAVVKVLAAQNSGDNNLGAAIPGDVLHETARPESYR